MLITTNTIQVVTEDGLIANRPDTTSTHWQFVSETETTMTIETLDD